jgi:hypothetical protein
VKSPPAARLCGRSLHPYSMRAPVFAGALWC